MKKSKLFKKVFGDPIEKPKEKRWYVTCSDIPHKDKKKETNRKVCRRWVREDPSFFSCILHFNIEINIV